MEIENYWWEDDLIDLLKKLVQEEQMSIDEVVLYVAKVIEAEKKTKV